MKQIIESRFKLDDGSELVCIYPGGCSIEEKGVCPKTMSGKHKFVDYSIRVCSLENPNGYKIDRPIKCEYCGMVDDREE